ncbi:MAG: response regulator, partial [Aliifodinibius sp.]|nr:response regulator [Fodinibius sp.]NIV12112.1 response regulator [Fodinibius sp.]NIY23785.1 response regulator [Fodinibius sp.]
EVEMAYSGKEALQKIDKRGYDVILTDLGMPEMSGWEVARAVKNKLPQSRVILVTGWGMQAEEELKNHDYVDQIIS